MAKTGVRVVVKEDSLHRSSYGSIVGVIYIAFDEQGFPEVEWSDFPVILLSWWLDAAAVFLDRPNVVTELRFMDGPFLVEATSKGDGSLRLDCVSDASRRQTEASFQTSAAHFCSELLKAAKTIERACIERAWQSADTLALSRSLANLDRCLNENRGS